MGTATDWTVEYLQREVPELRSGEYVLRQDVMIGNILKKGVAMDGREKADILVCRGDKVVLGIACSWETGELFGRLFDGLSWFWLTEDDPLPFEVSESLPSPMELGHLEQRVAAFLRKEGKTGGSLMSFRRRQLEGEGTTAYTLPAIPLETLWKDRVAEQARMIRRRLLHPDGRITDYGTWLGLFFGEWVEDTGEIRFGLMTTPSRAAELESSVEKTGVRREKTGLSQRLERLRKNLPSEDGYGLAALEQLLKAPLEELYRNHPGSLNRLRALLEREEFQSFPPVSSYEDGIYLVYLLRQRFGDDPWTDNENESGNRRTFESLVMLLSEPFLLQRAEPGTPMKKGKTGLARRLAALPGDTWKQYPAFRMPLCQYYQAASRKNGTDYPNWIYRERIRILFEGDQRPETAFDLMTLVLHCHNLAKDETVDDWEETYPLLYDLLVDPIISPEREWTEREVN